MLKNKNILILTHSYSNFHKNQIEILAPHFNRIYVLVRYKKIAEISYFIPCYSAKKHTFKNQFDFTDLPRNITVIPVPLWYLPIEMFYKYLGNYHLRIVDKIIHKNRIQFDMIHAHFIWTAGYVGYKLKEKYKVPFTLTGHGEDVYDYPFRSEFWKKKTYEILENADEVITVSRNNLECLHRMGITKKINVVSNGFLPSLFNIKSQVQCRNKFNLPIQKKIIITIGSLGIVKGHKYLIDAIKILKKSNNKILCIILGEGEMHNTLKKQIRGLKLEQTVILAGEMPYHLIEEWINTCDLFVLPSISEGFPVVQIEAMACGIPVVATRNGGSEEIITTDDLGYLCEKTNANDLADKIETALNKEWDHEKIVEHAQKYTWEKVMKQILSLYKKHLN
jgi:glycosyltransferase involved in cell wall biosynthesis